ncbi:MAG: hypothetical protein A3B79_03060 [Deltaproteobacteria bacterium RIFCSPHIGHO2_02_FULL_50_15]|nr:MAG: hypothetical protein A3B79_03060 [Deltaproteobacteria bacterium RIFCSPHIGHO2_02_FULL_50_15]
MKKVLARPSFVLIFTSLAFLILAGMAQPAYAVDCTELANFQAGDHLCLEEPEEGFEIIPTVVSVKGRVKPLENLLVLNVDRFFGSDTEGERVTVLPESMETEVVTLEDGSSLTIGIFGGVSNPVALSLPWVGDYTIKVSAGFINELGLPDPNPSILQVTGTRITPPEGQFELVQIRRDPGFTEVPFSEGDVPGHVVINEGGALAATNLYLCIKTKNSSVGGTVALKGTNKFIDLTYDSDQDGILDGEDPDDDNDGTCDHAAGVVEECDPGPDEDTSNRFFTLFSQSTSPYAPPETLEDLLTNNLCQAVECEGDQVCHPALGSCIDPCSTEEGGNACAATEYCHPEVHVCLPQPTCPTEGLTGGLKIYLLSVDLRPGENNIDVDIATPAGDEGLTIDPFVNQTERPDLCIRYKDQEGRDLGEINGRQINSQGVTAVNVEISFGACEADPQDVVAIDDGVCAGSEGVTTLMGCNDSCALCLQINNELTQNVNGDFSPVFRQFKKEDEDGRTVYKAQITGNRLQFPTTLLTYRVMDRVGRFHTIEHSFGYGEIHSFFDEEGRLLFNPVSNGLGGFFPGDFITQELVEALNVAVNTDKFKQELFPTIFQPKKPGENELDCPGIIDGGNKLKGLALYDPDIGDVAIQDFHLLNDNTAWVRLHISHIKADLEIFTMKFVNDGNAVGIEEIDRSVINAVEADNCRYDTCGQLKGAKVVKDPDLKIEVLPLILDADKGLTINLEVKLGKDANGKTTTTIGKITDAKNTHPLINLLSSDGRPYSFNCDKWVSRTLDSVVGTALDMGWSQAEMLNHPYGYPIPIDQAPCRSIDELDQRLNAVGIPENLQNMNVRRQLLTQIESLVTCNMPRMLIRQLDEFSITPPPESHASFATYEPKPLMKFELPMFKRIFITDIYAPLLSADLFLDPEGVSFQGGGLAYGAGAPPEGVDTAGYKSGDFMRGLPEELKTPDFGFLKEKMSASLNSLYLPDFAASLKRDVGIVLSQDMVNLVLHNVNTTLVDLASKPETSNFLDANRKRILEEFKMGVPTQIINEEGVPQDTCIRLDDEGNEEEVPLEERNKCFPVKLTLGGLLSQSDLDGDGHNEEGDIPLVLRMGLNPYTALTAKLLWTSSELGGIQNNDLTYPSMIFAGLRIDLSKVGFQILTETPNKANPQLKSWCEQYSPTPVFETGTDGSDVLSKMWGSPDPSACENGDMIPIVEAELHGRLTLILQITTIPNSGKYFATGGLVSRERTVHIDATVDEEGNVVTPAHWKVEKILDPESSYLKATILHNNTPVPTTSLAGTIKTVLGVTLGMLTFGQPTLPIEIKLPVQMPEVFEGCEPAAADDTTEEEEDLFGLLNDFGFEGVLIQHPILKINAEPPRNLGIGLDVNVRPCP